jgi:hypothetical protein
LGWNCKRFFEEGKKMTTNKSNFDYMKFLTRNGVTHLNYITHINNLNSILELGILCRNEVKKRKLNYTGIDWESVQNFRTKNIPEIHDFVPLFFATHTPMQYVTCVNEKLQNDIAVLKIDIAILGNDGVYFTDRNCAKEGVILYEDISNLPNLKWDLIKIKNSTSPVYITYKSAEVLVFNKVDISYIYKVFLATQETKIRVDRMVQTERKGIINVNPDEFY